MKNTDKVVISKIMTMNLNDFRDLVTDLCGEEYSVGFDYDEIRFIKLKENGEEDEEADADEISDFITDKLVEYFDIQAICSFKASSEFTCTDVIMPFVE